MWQASTNGVDAALLSEAHGLVTDLLLEACTMPPHLVSGLRALATLLSPPLPALNPNPFRARHLATPYAALSDVNYSSDTEEMPYTGERLVLSKVNV